VQDARAATREHVDAKAVPVDAPLDVTDARQGPVVAEVLKPDHSFSGGDLRRQMANLLDDQAEELWVLALELLKLLARPTVYFRDSPPAGRWENVPKNWYEFKRANRMRS
jgi:hypothetical protein